MTHMRSHHRGAVHAVLGAVLTIGAVACSHVTDSTAPSGATRSQLNVVLASETGPSLACGTSAPVTVTATTIDRRGRVVPVVGVVMNFRAMNSNTDLFAGAAITNSAGQASDRVTAGLTPGVPLSLEVRSVEAGTGVPTTHLALTRPVVMPPSAKLTTFTGRLSTTGAVFNVVKVSSGCIGADGADAPLPVGTPATFTRFDGTSVPTTLDGNFALISIESAEIGKSMSVTVGTANTGVLTLNYQVPAVSRNCATPVDCLY